MILVEMTPVEMIHVEMIPVEMIHVEMIPVDMIYVEMIPVEMIHVEMLHVKCLWIDSFQPDPNNSCRCQQNMYHQLLLLPVVCHILQNHQMTWPKDGVDDQDKFYLRDTSINKDT